MSGAILRRADRVGVWHVIQDLVLVLFIYSVQPGCMFH